MVADARGPSGQCEDAIRSAELRYRLPPGLLFAMSLAESGRNDPRTSRLRPWPWSVQANDTSHFFATKAEAVRWVRSAQASGTASIDTGCLQVNLMFHPRAFETVDRAFDPRRNVDYAAQFLVQLHEATSEWWQATGFYHSHTPALAASYRLLVQHAMALPRPRIAERPITLQSQIGAAWGATLPARAPERAAGRSWDSLLHAGDDGEALAASAGTGATRLDPS